MRSLKYLILFVCLACSLTSFSQDVLVNSGDTTSILDEFFLSKYLRFFQKEKDNLVFEEQLNLSTITNFDSLYKSRLDSIETEIPLSYNQHVKTYIDVYVNRKRKQVNVMLALSQYYFPIFEQALAANGVPEELKYLAIIESGLNPRAVSKMGASGLWQFMYKTGKMYDLNIKSGVDERYDPEKSSMAAARYLKDLYNSFGDWTLAIAAYNCGPGNVNKAIRKAKGKTDFWQIYSFLPRETRSYVPAFIGATYVMTYYQEHGYYPPEELFPILTDTLMVANEIKLHHIASTLNIPLQAIKDLNPQYTRNIIPGSAEQYSLRLPVNFVTHYIEFQDSIIYLSSNDTSHNHLPENLLKEVQEVYVTYRVKPKETLFAISRKFNVSVEELMEWNKLKSSAIYPNQVLEIHASKKAITEISQQKTGTPTPKVQDDNESEDEDIDLLASAPKNVTKPVPTSTHETASKTNPSAVTKSTPSTSTPKTVSKTNPPSVTKSIPSTSTPKTVSKTNPQSVTTSTPTNIAANNPKASTPPTKKDEKIIFYKVKKGDTLYGICKKHPGSKINEVIKTNNLTKNGNIIYPEQVLKIKM